ncbi:MAG: DUF456 domain-containing protein [Bacteroidales bacterium]|nr:DUF456 domain-containing protein [Bacteroidales bacterium]
MVDYILLILGIILMLIGLVGCVIPILPGPPISFIGLLLLQFSRFADYSLNFMLLMGAIALLVSAADYVVPVWGTKKMGGSKAGIWGAAIGLFLGIFFFPPIGLIVGPLVGAVLAELIQGEDFQKSFRAGMGSLMGFMLGIGIKLIASGVMTYYFVKALF